MKTYAIVFIICVFSTLVNAQKPTKADKAQERICRDNTEIIDDPFSNEKILKVRIYGANGDYYRVGPKLFLGAKSVNGKITLSVRFIFVGEREEQITENGIQEFSLYNGDEKVILKLISKSIVNPVAYINQEMFKVANVNTQYDFNYELSNDDATIFKNNLLKAIKLNFNGEDIIFELDNENRAQLFRDAFKCISK